MHRRIFIQNTALTLGALTLVQQKILSAFAQEPWKITMLRNDIGIFEEGAAPSPSCFLKKEW